MESKTTTQQTGRSQIFIDKEHKYGAHNYHPLPVVLERGKGVFVWDVDGKRYFDFLSGYSALSQGHCHPKLVETMIEQTRKLTLTSRAFHSDAMGEYMEFATKFFGYDKLLPMNTGAEAVETALKLCRRWAYRKKGVAENQAKIIVCDGNFHGRTITVISMSSDPESYGSFGPLTSGFIKIPYNNIEALREALKDPNVAGFLVEPVQGEAGVLVPDDGYLAEAYRLCHEKNVLFIADEIQCGIGRTGKLLCCDHDNVHPDILILAKALSGGMYPVSAVFADDDIMLTINPGEHGSTYGGNPVACRVAIAALEIVRDEKLSENSMQMGKLFRSEMHKIKTPRILSVRGRGLLNAVDIKEIDGISAWDICVKMMEKGVLAKPTHKTIIRFTPPLTITEREMREAIEIIKNVFMNL